MKPLLCLHFFRSATNAKKKQWISSLPPEFLTLENQFEKALLAAFPAPRDWERAQQLAHAETCNAQREGYLITCFNEPHYPSMLKELPDPPMALMGRGRWPLFKIPLAVVGTRKPTQYGLRAARELTTHLSEYPINFTSGLALGIDAAVHQAALDVGATTTAFLAGGMNHFTPRRHLNLARELVDGGGGYFTEQPFSQQPERHTFPVRNRLIAGASLATLVLEAARKSGALITANQAFHYGREVFALPGATNMPMSEGPNALIADEMASAVVRWEDFAPRFYPMWRKNDGILGEGEVLEAEILSLFPHGRRVKLDHISYRLNQQKTSVYRGLNTLMQLGYIERVGAQTYCRKTVH